MQTQSIDQEKVEAFAMRAVGDVAAAYTGVMVSLGSKLGLYRAMAGAGPLSAKELAARAGCAERYVREWLNAQAAGGYLGYHAPSDTYELSAEHALVLADEDSPTFIPHAWNIPAAMWFDEPQALEAFRTGRGVAWGEHDARMACGVAAFYRNGYRASLVSQWLPALDGVVKKLEAGARVADVGCGHGWSTVLMAKAYPRSSFVGYDFHGGSIEDARAHARQHGVAANTRFEVAKAKALPEAGFDLVTCFDCLHDMGDPAGAAAEIRRVLKPDGTWMVVEPMSGDRLEDNLNPVGRLCYAGSTMVCVPTSLSQEVGTALGAQAGEARLRSVIGGAGFGKIRRAAETPFNMVLEARV